MAGSAAVFSRGALDSGSARILQIGVLAAVVVAGALFLAVLLFDPERLPAKLQWGRGVVAEPADDGSPSGVYPADAILPSFSDRLDRRCQWIPDYR